MAHMTEQHIRIKVTAGAAKEHLAEEDGVLLIFVREPPQGSRANKRAVQMVAEHFRVPISAVRIVAGHHARNKTIEVRNSTRWCT